MLKSIVGQGCLDQLLVSHYKLSGELQVSITRKQCCASVDSCVGLLDLCMNLSMIMMETILAKLLKTCVQYWTDLK